MDVFSPCQLNNYIGWSGLTLRPVRPIRGRYCSHGSQSEASWEYAESQVGSRFAPLCGGYPLHLASNSPQYFAIITGIIFPRPEPTHWIWSLKILKTSLSALWAAMAQARGEEMRWSNTVLWLVSYSQTVLWLDDQWGQGDFIPLNDLQHNYPCMLIEWWAED